MRFGVYALDDFWKDQVEAERKSDIGLAAPESNPSNMATCKMHRHLVIDETWNKAKQH